MFNKITNIVVIVGLIAGFPGVIDAVTPNNVKRVQQDKAAKKWQKKINRLYAKNDYYQQRSNGVTVSSLKLCDSEAHHILGTNLLDAGLKALVLTVVNNSDQVVTLDGQNLLLPLLDENIVLTNIHKDLSYLKLGFKTYGISIAATYGLIGLFFLSLGIYEGMAGAAIAIGLLWPAFLISAFVSTVGSLYVMVFWFACIMLFPILLGLPLIITGLTLLITKLYTRSTDNIIRDHILNTQDIWQIEPGDRLDKIIFVPRDTPTKDFTLKLQQGSQIVPYFVNL